jgi:hypothetical protein
MIGLALLAPRDWLVVGVDHWCFADYHDVSVLLWLIIRGLGWWLRNTFEKIQRIVSICTRSWFVLYEKGYCVEILDSMMFIHSCLKKQDLEVTQINHAWSTLLGTSPANLCLLSCQWFSKVRIITLNSKCITSNVCFFSKLSGILFGLIQS